MLITINDIKKYDKSDMRNAIFSLPFQIEEMINNFSSYELKNTYNKIENILVLGMGGSAIGAEVCKVLIRNRYKIPIIINRNYSIPNWLNNNTLVIASSYSGETEETIESYNKASKITSNIIVISTGGTLTKIGKDNNSDIFIIPKNYQPRAAIGYSLMAILFCLIKTNITDYKIVEEISNSLNSIKKFNELLKKIDKNNTAIIMAKKLYKTIPVIYGGSSVTEIVALRFKGQLQENSKIISFHNVVPEMNHNEIEGWNNNNNFSIVWLYDKNEHDKIKKRINFSKLILEEINIKNYIINTKGSKFSERFLKLILYTDWISYYLAIINKIDPSPVEKITRLKKLLK